MSKDIIAIWAEDKNHLIGHKDSLPWRLPKELKHFKETTMGQVLLMGRVTFEGMNRRVLPGRQTIVLTRDKDYQAEGVIVLHSKEEVLEWFENQDKTLFIVGGARIYQSFLPVSNKLLKTEVDGVFEGDTYFPDYPEADFELVSEKFFEKDEKNAYNFTVKELIRKVA
ncbi:dihydrofolate reductase [Streptococcus thoraltensis]|uniref:dihydrofolate reductase n=1 Tax=Streptococcus thoraltensis TaxID=55085 RepID=UPI00036AA9C4|nr:dihydrofolate reductase [Streptococcus thoraltensis]MDY4762426.1 dihydrofolate reductase [Streptococcus thoraltensis]